MNIIWKRPDGGISFTVLAPDEFANTGTKQREKAASHAVELQSRALEEWTLGGMMPEKRPEILSWVCVDLSIPLPDIKNQNKWRWDEKTKKIKETKS